MGACAACGAALAGERCEACGAPADPATQAELGHLAYVLADVRVLFEERQISERGFRFLTDRYEERRARLLAGTPAPERLPATSATAAVRARSEPASPAPVMEGGAAAESAEPALPPAVPEPSRSLDASLVLLWLGAFLVTVASLIFVGYSWSLFSGPVKTLVMAALTVAFLGGGRLCLRRPTLRPAGQTFIAIGAALTPLTFVAAYNFWLSDEGLGWATLGLFAALTSAVLYGRLALALGGRLYPLATVLAALAAVGFGLAAADVPAAWWPAAAAASGLGLWMAGEPMVAGRLAVFRTAARGLGLAVAVAASLGPLVAAGEALMDGGVDWWPVAGVFVMQALHAALAATIGRRTLPAALAVSTGTLAAATILAALGGDRFAGGLVLAALAVVGALASARVPDFWRRALVPWAGLLALGGPWLALDGGDVWTARLPFVVSAAMAVAALAGLAWRWRQPGWLYGLAVLATAGYALALPTPGQLPARALALALTPLVLLAFGGIVVAGRRLGRPWALPGAAWLLLAGLPVAAALSDDPAGLMLALVVLAALAWLAVGLVGAAWLLVAPLGLLYAALTVALTRAQATDVEMGLAWLALAWLLLGWLIWWAAPWRGGPAWWVTRLRRLQQRLAGLAVAGSLTLALVLAADDPGAVWWWCFAAVTAGQAALTVAAAEATASRWGRRAGVAAIYLAALVALRALEMSPLTATYALAGLSMALTLAGLWLTRRDGQHETGVLYRLAGALGLGLALLGNVALALDMALTSVAARQAAFYAIVAGATGLVALWTRQPRGLYAAAGLLAVGLGFGIAAPGMTQPAQTLVFSLAGIGWASLGLAVERRSAAVGQALSRGGLGLAALAPVVALVTAAQPRSLALVASLLLLAGLLGLVATVQRQVRLAEVAAGVTVLALLARFAELGYDEVHLYSMPVALWLFGLAAVRERTGPPALTDWLTWAGVVVLLTPSLALGLIDEQGWRYALLAGVEALALLAVGLRWGRRAPVAGGSLALTLMAARQVFDGVRALPAWAIIGVVGLALLTVALVLLLRREDLERARGGLSAQWRAWR